LPWAVTFVPEIPDTIHKVHPAENFSKISGIEKTWLFDRIWIYKCGLVAKENVRVHAFGAHVKELMKETLVIPACAAVFISKKSDESEVRSLYSWRPSIREIASPACVT
jgi:hypothetical protein